MFAMDYQFFRDIGGSSLELFFSPFPLHTRKIEGRTDGQHSKTVAVGEISTLQK